MHRSKTTTVCTARAAVTVLLVAASMEMNMSAVVSVVVVVVVVAVAQRNPQSGHHLPCKSVSALGQNQPLASISASFGTCEILECGLFSDWGEDCEHIHSANAREL